MTWWPDFDLPRFTLGEIVIPFVALFALCGFGIMTYDPDYQRWWALALIAVMVAAMFHVKLVIPNSVFWALGFFAYAALSLLWSADARSGYDDLIGLAVILILFIGSRQVNLDPYMWVVPTAGLIACGLLWYLPARYGGFGNDTFIAEFLLIAGAFCLKGRARQICLVIILATLVFAVESNARRVVAIVAIAYGCYWLWCRGWKYAAFFLPVAGLNVVFLVGLADPGVIMSSTLSRAEIQINTALMILDAPMLGWGAGSFEAVYPRYQEMHMKLIPGMGTIMSTGTMFVNSAHNEYLQVFAEYGIVGVILAGGFLWSIRKSVIWPPVVTIAALSVVGFPLENPATAALALLAIRQQPSERCLAFPMKWPALAVSITLLWLTTLSLISESYMSGVRNAMASNPLGALSANLKAYELWPYGRGPRMQLPLTMTAILRNTPHRVTPESADNIHRISKTAGAESPGILLARLEYLVNARRNRDEANEIMHTMYRYTPRQLRIALGNMVEK